MRPFLTVTILVALSCAAGCNTTFRHLVTSYAPHDETRPVQVYPRAQGEACSSKILFFIPVGDNSTTTALLRMTKGSPQVDNILTYQVEEKWAFWLLGYTSCTVVSGYPVIYKDDRGKWKLFETNMLQGKLVSKPEVSEPTPYKTKIDDGQPAPKKEVETKTETSETEPVPFPPKKRETGPTQAECEQMCADFAKVWQGSDAIRATIRGQCMKKCLDPENEAYRECIKGAKKLDDITRCNSM